MTALAYRSHPGQPHEWSLPIPQLAGARACRNCGQLSPGLPSPRARLEEDRSVAFELAVIVEPYRACPRFEGDSNRPGCSVNLCPLDPLIGVRTADHGDRETRCTLGRRARRVLFARLPDAAKTHLPFGGLYESEFKRSEARRRLNAALTPEQREKQRATLRAHAFKPRTARAEAPAAPETPSDPSGGPGASETRSNGGEPA